MKRMGRFIAKAAGTIGATALTVGAFASSAFAQTFNANNVDPIPVLSGDLNGFITRLVTWALAIVGIIAVLYLIFGGVTYITAGGDAEKAGKGRVAITNAIIGIIIIMAAFIIYTAVIGAGA